MVREVEEPVYLLSAADLIQHRVRGGAGLRRAAAAGRGVRGVAPQNVAARAGTRGQGLERRVQRGGWGRQGRAWPAVEPMKPGGKDS